MGLRRFRGDDGSGGGDGGGDGSGVVITIAHSRSPVIGQNRLIGVEESLFRLYRGIELDQADFSGFPQTAKICLPVDLCRHFFLHRDYNFLSRNYAFTDLRHLFSDGQQQQDRQDFVVKQCFR